MGGYRLCGEWQNQRGIGGQPGQQPQKSLHRTGFCDLATRSILRSMRRRFYSQRGLARKRLSGQAAGFSRKDRAIAARGIRPVEIDEWATGTVRLCTKSRETQSPPLER